MTKRAVVVGVDNYSVQGFNNLGACVRDAQAMYHLLIDGLGFDPEQTWLYTDSAATSRNIRSALNYLLATSELGDTACLYFAGHGGLHPLTADTYYQTIIPYAGRFITDWDLFRAGERLRQHEVNFTIILDSCHSGGMHDESEQADLVRGVRLAQEMVDRIIQSMRLLVPFGVTVPSPEAFTPNVRDLRVENNQLIFGEDVGQQFTSQAKSTLFAACGWDELAGEGNGHGYFTQSFLDTVNMSNFEMDHLSLHQALQARTAQLSGNSQTVQVRGQANRMEEDFMMGWRDCR